MYTYKNICLNLLLFQTSYWFQQTGKFLQRWEYQTTLPVSWETCMQVKKKQLELDMEWLTGSKLGKEYDKSIYCHSAYLTYMQSTSCEMLSWMNHESQAGIKIAGRNTNSHRYADDTTLMVSEEELKSHMTRVTEDSEKAGLKLNIQKPKITISSAITSWQIEGEKVETMTDFIFLGSKITVDSDCSHEVKRHLILGRTIMKNLASILKIRDITLPTKFI